MEKWKPLRASHFSTPPTAALFLTRKLRYTNNRPGTKYRAVHIQPIRGVHAFAWQPGQNKLWVGKWWFGCMSPNLVNMSEHFSEKDTGFEFAPTSAQSVEEVNALDKELRSGSH
jgi:hypothetical protein